MGAEKYDSKKYDPEKTDKQLNDFINNKKGRTNTVDLSNNNGDFPTVTIYQSGDDPFGKELFDLYGRDKSAAKIMLNSIITDIGSLKKDFEDQKALITSKNETISVLNEEIKVLNDEIASLKEERAYLQKRLDESEDK